jgi:uracil-DNA glycosylase family 4
MMTQDRQQSMDQLTQEVANLTDSPLYEYRTENGYQPVIGQGSLTATIMFIGEAPGKNEAETGIPFCGASGRVLDQLLESVGIAREDVYISNVVKDRPPNNRDPHKKEIALYAPFLDRQIDIIQPEVIAPLGRFSMEFVLKRLDVPEQKEKISTLHGKLITATASYGPVKVLPLYHPAVSLYNASQKDTLFEDFMALKAFV